MAYTGRTWIDDAVFNTTAEGTPFSSPYQAPGKTVAQPGSAPIRLQHGLFSTHESEKRCSSVLAGRTPGKTGHLLFQQPQALREEEKDFTLSSLESRQETITEVSSSYTKQYNSW